MAQRTPSRQTTTRSTRQARRLNRAEQQAMEIRRVSTESGLTAVKQDESVVASAPRMAGSVSTARTRRRRENGPTARAMTLTRDQEYGFIRTDLRRLLLLSGVLVVAMIAALVAIEALV